MQTLGYHGKMCLKYVIMTRKGHKLRPVHGTSRQPVYRSGKFNEIRETNQDLGVHESNAHKA